MSFIYYLSPHGSVEFMMSWHILFKVSIGDTSIFHFWSKVRKAPWKAAMKALWPFSSLQLQSRQEDKMHCMSFWFYRDANFPKKIKKLDKNVTCYMFHLFWQVDWDFEEIKHRLISNKVGIFWAIWWSHGISSPVVEVCWWIGYTNTFAVCKLLHRRENASCLSADDHLESTRTNNYEAKTHVNHEKLIDT